MARGGTTVLLGLLRRACPDRLRAIPEPAVQLSAATEFSPDLAVVRREDLRSAKCTTPPELVAEIRSPSTALIDLGRKKAAYERFGIPSYWVIDPDFGKPSLTVFELAAGRYTEVAFVSGAEVFQAQQPFPVEVSPAALVAGLLG